MLLNNINIISEDVELTKDCAEKIHQIATITKKVSASPDVNIRLLKNGESFECLLWGRLDGTPIGAFHRGHSANLVLDNICKRVRKDCLKVLQEKVRNQSYEPHWDRDSAELANAG